MPFRPSFSGGIGMGTGGPLWVALSDMPGPQGWQGGQVILQDGRMLVVGGYTTGDAILGKTYTYHPNNGWATMATLNVPRVAFSICLLSDGRVLVAGGLDALSAGTLTCEVYDPDLDQWALTDPLLTARLTGCLVTLDNGKSLLASGGDAVTSSGPLTCALYDPTTDLWTATGSVVAGARRYPVFTKLADGSVLIAGGNTTAEIKTAERYNPTTGLWTAVGSTTYGHTQGNMVFLSGISKALLIGGGNAGVASTFCELFDPGSNTWSTANPIPTAVYSIPPGGSAFLHGKAVVAGGYDNAAAVTGAASAYDELTGSWTVLDTLITPRATHFMMVVGNQIIVAGGYNDVAYLSSAEKLVGL